jgi:hypothetical protein
MRKRMKVLLVLFAVAIGIFLLINAPEMISIVPIIAMADVFTRRGYDGTVWTNIVLGGSDYLSPQGSAWGDGISVGGFQDSNHKTDSGMTSDGCTPNHIRNCKYISTTEVSLNGGGAVTLNTSNVADTDCTLEWNYTDDTPTSTALSNVRLIAYDGADINNPPSGITVVAFERTGSQIYKSTDAGADQGWDSANGIGGLANALICSDRSTSAGHNYYFGISMSPTSKGQKTCKLRFEFDAT